MYRVFDSAGQCSYLPLRGCTMLPSELHEAVGTGLLHFRSSIPDLYSPLSTLATGRYLPTAMTRGRSGRPALLRILFSSTPRHRINRALPWMCVWRGPTPDEFKKFRRNPQGKAASGPYKKSVLFTFPLLKSKSVQPGMASKNARDGMREQTKKQTSTECLNQNHKRKRGV